MVDQLYIVLTIKLETNILTHSIIYLYTRDTIM